MSMKETRVSRLLRDARAAVNRPVRPQTPLDAVKAIVRRDSDVASTRMRLGSDFIGSAAVAGGSCVAQSSHLSRFVRDLATTPPDDADTILKLLGSIGKEFGSSSVEVSLQDCQSALRAVSPYLNDGRPMLVARAAAIVLRNTTEEEPCKAALKGVLAVLSQETEHLLFDEKVAEPVLQRLSAPCQSSIVKLAAQITRSCSASSEQRRKALVTLGVLPQVTTALKNILSARPESTQLLEDLVIALRNFGQEYAHHFLKLGTLEVLCPRVTESFKASLPVMAAVARALAKLTDTEECIEYFDKSPAAVSSLCNAWHANLPQRSVASRFAYSLGNIMESSGAARSCVARCCPSFLRDLLAAVTSSASFGEDEEAAVLALRCLSNATLCPDAANVLLGGGGAALCALAKYLAERDIATDATIVLHAVMCIANLSYYLPTLQAHAQVACVEQCGPLMVALMLDNNTEGVVESTRIMGNISAVQCGLGWMESHRVDELLLALCQHPDRRVRYNCVGTLLNLTAQEAPKLLLDRAASQMLQEAAERLAQEEDPEMGPLVQLLQKQAA